MVTAPCGGAFTECAVSDGITTSIGWKIIPLSFEQAREFAFDSLPADVALAEFEPAPEDVAKKK